MNLLKCMKCGALVNVINECKCGDCGIKCCGEAMSLVKPNSVDASFEKHLPQYKIVDNKIEVTIPHVMEEDHYIEFITLIHDNIHETVYLDSNNSPKAIFDYYKNSTLYSYCNKHGLWKTDVE